MGKHLVTLALILVMLTTGCAGPKQAAPATTQKAAALATTQPTTVPTAPPPTALPPTAVPPTAVPPTPTAASAAGPTTPPTAAVPTKPPTSQGISVTAARSVEVSALWYGTDQAGKPTGGTSKVRITVEPNATKQFRVGFFEGEVAGSGPMWRASGWVATIMAALLTGFDPAQTQVSFDVGGRIDGPSAGGLMTSGVLAALRGDKIRDDAAMTGTINPDGTIGPVGGIPYKIEGAAKAGKKLVLIPVGRSEGGVDLVERGKQLGVEVREVPDIYTAYEALTGKALNKPATSERPQLTGPTYDRLASKAKEWLARYQEADAQYAGLHADVKSETFDAYIALAKKAADRSTRLVGQGMAAGAYGQAVDATVYATIASQSGRIVEVYVLQGLDGALKQLKATASFDTKVSAIADRLKAEQPRTLAGAGALIEAYGALIQALGLADTGSGILGQISPKASQEDIVGAIAEAALYLRMADLKVETAKDILDIGSGLGGAPLPEHAPLASVTEFFRRASEANMNLFDTVVLAPLAEPVGMSLDAARVRFGASDFAYAQARSSLLVMPKVLERYFGAGSASTYAQLGGALSTYSASCGLIAKYYSLDAQLDQDLSITGYGKERALLDTLDLADEQARGSIAFLRKSGIDPALSIIIYESARLSRDGDVSDKMDALTSFWDVYIQTRALAYLGGFAGG